jgi:hypothetical protein
MNESVENMHSARFNRAAAQNRDQKTGETIITGKLDDSMYEVKEELTLNI